MGEDTYFWAKALALFMSTGPAWAVTTANAEIIKVYILIDLIKCFGGLDNILVSKVQI